MQLVSFDLDGQTRLGALRSDGSRTSIVDLNAADPRVPADMLAFLVAGDEARALASYVVDAASPAQMIDLDKVTLQAPIPRPGKIMCIGLNYRDHAAESGVPLPEFPTVFAKYANTVVGSGAPIVLPEASEQVDYEGEFAFVIGKRTRNVPVERALDFVAGYLPFNDVSARDFQHRTSQWTIGKSFDTFAPMGPALVTADEIPDPHDLDLRVTVNGEVLQASNTRNLVFTVPDLIAYISAVMTLEPGDVVATGTPGGVGAARTPPRFLHDGDVVEVQIERLGKLTNRVSRVA